MNRDKVFDRIFELEELAEEKGLRTPAFPDVKFNLRGRVAGQAMYYKNTIRVNEPLLNENLDHYILQTIGHEYAHLLAPRNYGVEIKPHGYQWKHVMKELELKPSRCHNYKTKSARRMSLVPYECEKCGKDFNLTKIRHNKIKRGTTYRHASNCGGKLVEKRVYNAETLLLIHNIK